MSCFSYLCFLFSLNFYSFIFVCHQLVAGGGRTRIKRTEKNCAKGRNSAHGSCIPPPLSFPSLTFFLWILCFCFYSCWKKKIVHVYKKLAGLYKGWGEERRIKRFIARDFRDIPRAWFRPFSVVRLLKKPRRIPPGTPSMLDNTHS